MDQSSQQRIRRAANELTMQLWERRSEHWPVPPSSLIEILPIEPVMIARILQLTFEEPEEIVNRHSTASKALTVETAGLLDRTSQRIVVAQKFKLEWRRFTAAHEIGHYVLHPAMLSHRDRPLEGGERANTTGRSLEEQEADLFAAELLMPTSLLLEAFSFRYGESVDGREPNEDVAYWLSVGTGERVDAITLASRGPRYRALLIAKSSSFGGRVFVPLAELFRVSPTTMAIQLEDLRLVI